MVRSKGTTIQAAPGTVEFQKEAYLQTTTVPLSSSEIKELNEEKQVLQTSLEEAQNAGASRSVDTVQIKQKINRIDEALIKRAVSEIMGASKDKLYREEKDIEDRLVVGMPTRYEMDFPHKNPGAVRKHMAWDARNKLLIERYVEIQRILRPEEPKSIEELRTEGGPRR